MRKRERVLAIVVFDPNPFKQQQKNVLKSRLLGLNFIMSSFFLFNGYLFKYLNELNEIRESESNRNGLRI